MPRRTLAKVETVVYKGITFRRYPESRNWSDKSYYRPNSVHIGKGVQPLHREIWRDHYGEIPDGHDIHHKDGNPDNNTIDNLECLSGVEHARIHAASLTAEQRQQRKENVDRIRPLTVEWHRSAEGRQWHSEHGKQAYATREPRQYHCEFCGAGFQSTKYNSAKFCTNKCKSAARRASGIDNVQRACEECGKEFTCHKYNHTRFCSSSCSTKHIWRTRKS